MRRFWTLLLVTGLATAPAIAAGDPCHDTHVESSQTSIGKGRLGVLVLGITPELRMHYGAADDRGVLVARVQAGSPAAAAGLQAGDVITDAGGQAIDQASDLVNAVSRVAKDKPLDLKVVRDHKTLSLNAKLASDPVGFMDFDWFREMFRRFEPQIPRTSNSST
jgi:membrane-associated protease RseP (regulator of RpoE activity)